LSTSPLVPSEISASFSPVAGLFEAKILPGLANPPSMKCPNLRPCFSSQSSAGPAASGAGPYSRVSKISATLLMIQNPSGHREAVIGGVMAGDAVFDLPLDVG